MIAVQNPESAGQSATNADYTFAVRLMQHLVVPTFVLDSQGRVLIWNRACERLTGLPAKEVIGTKDHWRGFYEAPRFCLADIVLQGNWSELATLYAEHEWASADQPALSAQNWCAMPRAGSVRYLAIDAGPIFSEAGELIAVVETLRDITIQKEAQLALEALAHRDALTGLSNRRMFDESLEVEWRRAQRADLALSLLMIDIDHFKAFNDAAGHQAGDVCLRQIATLIAGQMLRPGDMAARYGGEEFAVILPGVELDGALAVADRIAAATTALALPNLGLYQNAPVTLSIGAASAGRTRNADAGSLLADADAALYQAKRAGRDRIVRFSRSPQGLTSSKLALIAG